MRFLDFWRWSLLVMSVSLLWSCESILGDLDKDDVDDEEEEEIVEWGTALLEVSAYNVVFDGESIEQEMHITAKYHYTELGIENVRDMEWKIECREMSLQDLPFSFSAASGVGDADVVVTHTSGELTRGVGNNHISISHATCCTETEWQILKRHLAALYLPLHIADILNTQLSIMILCCDMHLLLDTLAIKDHIICRHLKQCSTPLYNLLLFLVINVVLIQITKYRLTTPKQRHTHHQE